MEIYILAGDHHRMLARNQVSMWHSSYLKLVVDEETIICQFANVDFDAYLCQVPDVGRADQ